MTSAEIRQSFLDFFAERGHKLVPSAPLVPHGDPTLLFTNAGMVPFKNYFLGVETPPARRAASAQKCLRVSGKHNDLENVGPSPRHHTFFEMLGNFSFGDYFKRDAIAFAWELVTRVWGLAPERLFATVYEEDDEAEALWLELSTLPRERVVRCGAKDNFWAMGETGPCGPSSEIMVDLAPHLAPVGFAAGAESGRYLEIWNLVFMQFDRNAAGELTPLPNPSIDTGSGLERVSAVLQGVASNYDTDLFQPILRAAAALAKTEYGSSPEADVSLRVIADHLRAVAFLLADGVIPGNEGRGYVLRRLLRRAARHGMRLGLEEPFLHRLLPVLGKVLGEAYPELGRVQEASAATIEAEEAKFLSTVAVGARQMQEEIEKARREGRSVISGAVAFRLYDTHGLPLDVMREIAEEERFAVDEAGFEEELRRQRERSRKATGEGQKRLAALAQALRSDGAATVFDGYSNLELEGVTVLRLARLDGTPVERLAPGESGAAVFDRTVFYAEGGGEIGDQGEISWQGGAARITDTQKDGAGRFIHLLEVGEGAPLAAGVRVGLAVDAPRRRSIQRHHTATHLLHAALHEVLGAGARQAGSLVAPDRLRFDFTFPRPMTAEELARVEARVNDEVLRASPTRISERPYREALAAGAMALFGEKYGEVVRTVEVPGVSLELCGGCHVGNTGEIGPFLLAGERGIASGVRRIEALAGEAALAAVREQRGRLERIEEALGVPADRAPEEIERLRRALREREDELSKLRLELVSGARSGDGGGELVIDGVRVLVREVPHAPANELRNMADTLRGKLGSGVVFLGAREGEKVSLVASVTKDLAGRVHAGELVKAAAALVGGGGGGRPDFAQAGGKDPAKLPEALAAAESLVRRQLAG